MKDDTNNFYSISSSLALGAWLVLETLKYKVFIDTYT